MISELSERVIASHDSACERFFREAICKVIPHRATSKFRRHHTELAHKLLFDLNIVLTRIANTGDNFTHLTASIEGTTFATAKVGIRTTQLANEKQHAEILYTPVFLPVQRVPDHHPAIKAFIKEYKRQTAAYIGKGKA